MCRSWPPERNSRAPLTMQLAALGGELGLVVQQGGAAFAVFGLPGGPLGGLELDLAIDLHQDTLVRQGLHQGGDAGTQFR